MAAVRSLTCDSEVRLVTKYPGQEEAAGDSKVRRLFFSLSLNNTPQVPTLVAYKRGKPIGYGVDAIEQAATQDGELAKWFKVSYP